MTTLRMFDFDGTTFRSPGPPADWPESVDWYGQELSLLPPAIPDRPGPEWWIPTTLRAAREAFAPDRDPDLAFMVTGRWPVQGNRIRELLGQVGIDVPAVHCKPPGMDTVEYKSKFLARAVDVGAELVEVWEDFEDYLEAYRVFVEEELSLPFIGHLIRYNQPPAGGPVPSPYRVASRHLSAG